jgi:RNA polymerase sigma factor (TIGR02999 family)
VKRGGDWQRITLDERIDAVADSGVDLLELDDALSRLARLDERTAQIVELRFFGGLTEEEIAHVLDISRRTVQREWWTAKMWLRRELAGADGSHEL